MIFKIIFTWWNKQTLGTYLKTLFFGIYVGKDEFGNRYYKSKKDERWVIYRSEIEATKNLNLINQNNKTKFIMTYSYGRALQQSALGIWSKNIKNIKATQNIFNHRAKMCSLAALGKWSNELENK